MNPVAVSPAPGPTISRSEWGLILILFAVQFTNILDFMIVMPLGPQVMHELTIGPNRFGILVSAYGFAAGLGCLIASSFLDRYPRRSCLMFAYAGFGIATLLCGLAPTFETMLAARSLAGLFGGIVGAAVMSIVGDVFEDRRRATATGAVMSAFAVASVLGVPLGIFLGTRLGIWAPFILLGGSSVIVFALMWAKLPRLAGHVRTGVKSQEQRFWEVLKHPNHIRAYLFSLAVIIGTAMVIPYIATYMVLNAGQHPDNVMLVYLVGGLCTLVAMNVVGRLADRHGKLLVFRVAAGMSLIMSLILTNLPPVPLAIAVLVGGSFMVFAAARIVPAQAMMTASATPSVRGSFLAVNTALQHFALGAASLFAGLLLDENEGRLSGFSQVGIVAASCAGLAIWIGGRLRNVETPNVVAGSVQNREVVGSSKVD